VHAAGIGVARGWEVLLILAIDGRVRIRGLPQRFVMPFDHFIVHLLLGVVALEVVLPSRPRIRMVTLRMHLLRKRVLLRELLMRHGHRLLLLPRALVDNLLATTGADHGVFLVVGVGLLHASGLHGRAWRLRDGLELVFVVGGLGWGAHSYVALCEDGFNVATVLLQAVHLVQVLIDVAFGTRA